MQDVTAVHENSSRNSQILEIDYEIQSKTTTTTTKPEQRRISSLLPSLLPDPIVSPKIIHRNKKPNGYAPPASDRESWWRVTIKVRLKLYLGLYIFLFICIGYTKSWYI
jgi:hypothetical protein